VVWQRSYSEAEVLVAVMVAGEMETVAAKAEVVVVAVVVTDWVAWVAMEDLAGANRRRYKKARTIGKPSSDWSMQHRVQR